MKEPKDWSQVRIDQFAHIYDVIIDSSIENYDKDIRILSILTEKSVDQIEDLSIASFNKLRDKFKWAYNVNFKAKPIDPVRYGKYKLVFVRDIYNSKQFKAGSYIDLMKLTEDGGQVHYNIDRILNTLCKVYERSWLIFWKESELTNSEKLELIKKAVPIDLSYSYAVFFCHYANNLTKNTKDYLLRKVQYNLRKSKKLLKKDLKNIGVGLRS